MQRIIGARSFMSPRLCVMSQSSYMPVLKQTQDQQERRRKIFPQSQFVYDPQSDTYRCPAGQTLSKRKHWAKRQAFEYVTAKGICQKCNLRIQCTQSESGRRTLKRHERQQLLDRLRAHAQSATARRDIKIRQHFMVNEVMRLYNEALAEVVKDARARQ